MTYIPSVREVNEDLNTIYTRGRADADNSWRYNAESDVQKLQHFEPLTETDIDLDEAHIVTVEAGGFTTTNQYFASVLTDSRVNKLSPTGLLNDQTGRFIAWDGLVWRTSPEQWFTREEKASDNTTLMTPFDIKANIGTVDQTFIETAMVRSSLSNNVAVPRLTFHRDLSTIKWDGNRIGATRTIQVLSEDDFPDPVGGLIPLERFRHYFIDDNVTVTTPFLMPTNGPVEFSSDNFNNNDLRCQIGTQALFQGANVTGLVIRDLAIEDRDGNQATVFDITQVDSEDFSKIIFQDMTLIEFNSLGTLKGFNSVKVKDNRLALYEEGITFEDCDIVGSEGNLYLGLLEGGAVDVTIKGTNGTFSVNAETWSSDDNAVAMDIDSASVVSQATVTNSTYAVPTGGQFFQTGSKDQTDPSWRFEVNGELEDSNVIASASFSGNTTETVIASAGVPVAVAGTTAAGPLERFTHDPADNSLTYTGSRDITMRVKLIGSVEVVGNDTPARYAETDTIAFCAFKNGTAVASTRDKRPLNSVFQNPTSPEFISQDNIMLSPGDKIQMFVENEDNPTNIIVTDLKMLINK